MGTNDRAAVFFASLRWFARIVGFLASGFFLLFFLGEGAPDVLENGLNREIVPFLALLLTAIVGYVVALFHERAGGLLLIAGGGAMGVYHLAAGGIKDADMALVFGLPFLLCGCVFLFVSAKTQKRRRRG